jgi:protein-L-isoaspartate(D-aspartate) O-methyltransferase
MWVPSALKDRIVKDSYRHKGMRRQLVEHLRRRGIADERVLAAMQALPRHFFLDQAFEDWAYEDKAFPIDQQQTISQPYTVALMTSLLEVSKRDKILEIGTGSGYQAAILALLGARVYSVERQELLYQKAKKLLSEMGIGGVRLFFRDGHKGLPEYAPFEKIIVTAAAERAPPALLQQLNVGGLLVMPIGKQSQKMYRIERTGEEAFQARTLGRFRFVPFVEGVNTRGE